MGGRARAGGGLAQVIYKICRRGEWRDAEQVGAFRGAPVDLADGYIHFSTGDQVAETARRHFAGFDDLLLVAVAVPALGPALKWEPSRGGALFPHLYGVLTLDAVLWAKPLPLGGDGRHIFPELEP
jgi:uncharacterized protein (DUF952 family)